MRHHASFSPSRYPPPQTQPPLNLVPGSQKALPIVSDADAENFFHLRFIRRCGGDAGKLQHAMARVERYGNLVQPALFPNYIQQGWRGGAVSVVGNQQRIGSPGIFAGGKYELTTQMAIGAFTGFAVKAHDLLSGGVRESGQDARFGHGGVTLVLQNPANRNTFVAESAKQ